MEELGIGRPSTYASTLAVLQERDYVRIDKKRLIPEDKGRLVTAFLESFFKRYVEYDFTADLEEKLDLISDGKLEWKDVLRDFWRDFMHAVSEIKDLRVGDVLEALNELLGPHIFPPKAEGGDPRLCPNCGEGRLSLKISGKYGAFIGCSRYPDCRYTRQLSQPEGPAEASTPDGKLLGTDPETGLPVTLRTGRFGPYVQLGEGTKEEKPKRSSIPKGVDANTVDLAYALKLLSLPREVGLHPETGKPITAGLGRYGPFILHDGTYANLPTVEEVFDVGINRAVVLLAEKKAGGGKGRWQRAAPTVLKELGDHPSEGGKVQVLSGRYGPYVKHGDVNATLPRGKEPAALTMDEAVQLIAERVAKGPSKPKGGRRRQERQGGKDREARRKPPSPRARRRRWPAPKRPPNRPRNALRRWPTKPKKARRAAGLPSKARHPCLHARRRRQDRQARARARLLRQGLRSRHAQSPARRDERGGPARRQPQGLQGARAAAAGHRARHRRARCGRRADRRARVWDAAEGERPRALVLAPRGTGRQSASRRWARATASWRA